ncbi:MAG: hypothetical protein JXR03_09495 [Cyclobacteriaceae bacterium]
MILNKSTYKLIKLPVAICVLAFFAHCNDRTLEDLDLAQGKVAGQDWVFASGNAIRGINEIEIILMNFETSNPCGVLNPPRPYVKFTVPATPGTYSIPFSETSKTVKFFEGSSSAKSLSSTSGFVQIISINGFTVDALIQASFDDDNDIAGAFFATSCN